MSQHGQRDVAMPASPRAYLVLVKADLAFGRLKAGLDRPAHSRHPHQRFQAGRSWRQGKIKGQLVRFFE
jgi:hypothetical protein